MKGENTIDIKVSIVIPVYNAEKYIRKQLDSLVNQTYQNMEIICVNDGSVDSSEQILSEYAQRYNFIKTYTQVNAGSGAARNLGMKYATGKYLIFLDADDFCCANMLEKAVGAAENTGAELVVFDFYRYNNELKCVQDDGYTYIGADLYGSGLKNTCDLGDRIFQIGRPFVTNKLWSRTIIVDNDIYFPNISRCEDLPFAFEATMITNKIFIINERLAYYRINNQESRSSGFNATPAILFEAMDILRDRLISRDRFQMCQNSFYRYMIEGMQNWLGLIEDKGEYIAQIDTLRNIVRESLLFEGRYQNPALGDILLKGNIVIYGAGKLARTLIKYFIWIYNMSPENISIVVSPEQINPSQLCGIRVKTINEYTLEELQNCVIAVTAESAIQTIKDKLALKGVASYVEFRVEDFVGLLLGDFDEL